MLSAPHSHPHLHSDDGSTAVEVALKMALQHLAAVWSYGKTRFVAFQCSTMGIPRAPRVSGGQLLPAAFPPFTSGSNESRMPKPSQLWIPISLPRVIIEPLVQGAAEYDPGRQGIRASPTGATQIRCSLSLTKP